MLVKIYQGVNLDEELAQIMRRWPDNDQQLREVFRPSIEVYEAVKAAIPADDESIRYLLSEFEEIEESSQVLLYMFIRAASDILKARLAEFSELLLPADSEPFADRQAIVSHMKGKGFSLETQANLLLIFDEYETFYAIVDEVLGKIEAVLRDYVATIQPLIDEKAQDLREAVERNGFDGLFRSVGIPVEPGNGFFTDIYMRLVLPNEIGMVNEAVMWGIGVLDINRIKGQSVVSVERVQDVLKALADHTKFEIVQILSTETLYGGEIAERLSLSAATISHHLSQLGSLRLVRMIREANRIYYRTEKETVSEYLKAAERMLQGRYKS